MNVEVIGGEYIGGDEDNNKKDKVFRKIRSEIVEPNQIAILFRRDWEMAQMPVIQLRDTPNAVTVRW